MTLHPDDRRPKPFLGGLLLVAVAAALMVLSDGPVSAAITLLIVGIVLIGTSRQPVS